MFVTLAGAMSTAELGLSLAEMIRQDKVHAICCTGANLEEDIFNLVAHDSLRARAALPRPDAGRRAGAARAALNRVTDTCIPEEEAMRRIETAVLERVDAPTRRGERYFPHEFMYRCCAAADAERVLPDRPADSWLLAAAEKNLPIFVPGWEDSTLGNIFARSASRATSKNVHTVRTGIEYMIDAGRVVHEQTGQTHRSASSRSAAASPATSRSASCRCCTRTCSARRARCGATSARSATRPRATARTRAPCPTRRSPGASSTRHAEVHHRVRRHDRGAADLRLRPGVVRRFHQSGRGIPS